jgi:hypothetical protein
MEYANIVKGVLFVLILVNILFPPMLALGTMQADPNKQKLPSSKFVLSVWIPMSVGILLLWIFLFFHLKDAVAEDLFTPNLIFAITSLYFSITILILVLLRMKYATSPKSE